MLKSKLTDNLIVNHKVQMENTAQREQIFMDRSLYFCKSLSTPNFSEFDSLTVCNVFNALVF